ncbi:hypothetical protein BARBAKC583_0103 [Bartonella bacilliformis KC583]|uniref:Uncharacterized protein n=1 Tax=Bartonella bacilliformis (strain ATCC 35685 / KC583 / Herrer 020/F12,63) TaxID=360095 RepID=A1UR38_BARBK|nr:hypothetical protein BARBAKC583_0103 [Bartonella bacilliformis KC583]
MREIHATSIEAWKNINKRLLRAVKISKIPSCKDKLNSLDLEKN